jgi:chromosome segregation ATPase
MTLELLLSLIGTIGGFLIAWTAYQKLRPEKKKIEVEAEYREVEASALIADKAMQLLRQMEESLTNERERLVRANVDLMAQLAAAQGEIEDLLEDAKGHQEVIQECRRHSERLRERYDGVIGYLKEYVEIIDTLLIQMREEGIKPQVKLPKDWEGEK